MTVLNEKGKDSEEAWMTNMLRHWLSNPAVSRAVATHKLVALTPEDHRQIADDSMPKGRAAHIMRRILFHDGTLRTIASMFSSRHDCSLLDAQKQLRQIRTEVKEYAHASQSGLILPGDPNLPKLPKINPA